MSEPTPPPAPAVPVAPAKSGNRTLIIVLCVIGGLLLLMGGCAVACTYVVGKKAKEFAEESEKNPAYAGLTLVASFTPDIEVVSKDPVTGIVKLRNKKTNETVTIDTTQYTADNIGDVLEKIAAGKPVPAPPAGDEPKSVSAGEPVSDDALAATLEKFPPGLPAYPGATTLQAEISTAPGARTYEYSAQTKDKPDVVTNFYAQKLAAAGFTVLNRSTETNDHGAASSLTAAGTDPAGTVTIQAATQENGQVQVEITGLLLGKE